jgi:uncharacterized damage-inducible protein DinB
MRQSLLVLISVYGMLHAAESKAFRPPAVPLVTHDPYFSVWSMGDRLTEDATKHWTGSVQALTGMVRVDGKTYRIMGREPQGAPAMPQTRLEVLPTRTIYEFAAAGVRLTLTFLTPALPHNLEVLSRPVTYVVWEASSTDGSEHDVSLYFEASAELVVNTPDQPVTWSRFKLGDLSVLRMGSEQQPVLEKSGDNLRIDWGYLYLAAPAGAGVWEAATDRQTARSAFQESGRLPDADDFSEHRPARRRMPVLAYGFDLGKVSASAVSRYLMLAYDDLFSIEYFQRRLRPWWRRKGDEASDLLRNARRDYEALRAQSQAFDEELMSDLRRAGGEQYARLAALAYRQTVAAHKLVADADGTPLMFPKENFSNGCIGTVDVIYPSSPFFLLFNTRLLKAQIQPVLDYAAMERWPWPFAPHDLGTYPQANGQVYGGGERTEERQMPVEESGNMLLMVAAIARTEGHAQFAARYWPLLTRWAEYLKEKGLDPENQLSTDDFAGHLARNANLSVKAILALGAYGTLCEMTGRREQAVLYRRTAQEYVKKWMELADDGDHYRLAFDKAGTWSQKYNLVWDRLLGLNLFPAEVAGKEIAYYKTRRNRYGLPLDNRQLYTKLDWVLWTATLAESAADFEALAGPAYRFADESPTRVPLTDWYWTQDARQRGFQARSVVGGVFVKMLADPEIWKKWAGRAMPASRPLTQGERGRAMSELHATRKRLLDAIAGLSKAQWNFKPGPDRWSVAECAEHIAVTEDFNFELVTKKILQSPAAPEKQVEVQGKDEFVLRTMADRSSKRVASEALQPAGRWRDAESLAAHFKQSRDRLIAYVETTQDDLRSHFLAHRAVGLLDGYQWILLMAGHTERHVLQIEEVKAQAGFPKAN